MAYTIARLVNQLFNIYNLLVLIWCILSWIPAGGFIDDLRGAIGALVEPYLSVFRRIIPPLGGVDFAPIIAMFVLDGIRRLVINILL